MSISSQKISIFCPPLMYYRMLSFKKKFGQTKFYVNIRIIVVYTQYWSFYWHYIVNFNYLFFIYFLSHQSIKCRPILNIFNQETKFTKMDNWICYWTIQYAWIFEEISSCTLCSKTTLTFWGSFPYKIYYHWSFISSHFKLYHNWFGFATSNICYFGYFL